MSITCALILQSYGIEYGIQKAICIGYFMQPLEQRI